LREDRETHRTEHELRPRERRGQKSRPSVERVNAVQRTEAGGRWMSERW